MKKHRKSYNKTRQEFLLSFFDNEPVYQVIFLKDHYLVKQFNNGTDSWEVAIWPKSSWNAANMDAHGHTVVRKHLVNTQTVDKYL